ncbi:hypothetical protein AAHZ94_30025, partial [Streptomyces sp. HSW2009]|uniref:hypothetical protein n=1 Tax=Streptomyces sp. HSW2009 TaxID=3142890 RepID=UPI0032EEDEBB
MAQAPAGRSQAELSRPRRGGAGPRRPPPRRRAPPPGAGPGGGGAPGPARADDAKALDRLPGAPVL